MIAFLVRRTAWAIVTLWLVVSGSFALAYLLPADPARMVAGPHASPEVVLRVRHELGLDRPVFEQYALYLARVAHGDLGKSYRTDEKVTDELARRAPMTAILAVGASIAQLVIGVPIGLFSALRRGRWEDAGAMAVALVGISAPTFLIGLTFVYVFGFQLDLFPIGGAGHGLAALARSAVLPSLTLGTAGAAYYSRLVRGEYLDIASRDFMRTARAKGLAESTVVWKHGLRNALIPVVTFFGVDFGTMLGGAVITESVYAWPGLGRLVVDSVLNLDLPVMLGVVLLSSAFIVFANLAVDMLYAFLDPRIRVG